MFKSVSTSIIFYFWLFLYLSWKCVDCYSAYSEETSGRLCSKDDEFMDPETGYCKTADTNCFRNMKFYSDEEGYGGCDCDVASKEPLAYLSRYRGCYFLHTQGPCGLGEWVTINPISKSGTCARNPCILQQLVSNILLGDAIWLERFGRCWRTATQAFCGEGEEMTNGVDENLNAGICSIKKVRSDYPYPVAPSPYPGPPSSFSIPCLAGYKYSKSRRCRQLASFRKNPTKY